MNKKNILHSIQIVLSIALVIFIVVQAEAFFSKVRWPVVVDNWVSIVVAGILFLVGYMFMALHWYRVAKMIDATTKKKQWLAYFASQPYKYLPTSFFTFSFRAVYAKKLGLNIRQSSEAQIIENANLVGSALVLGMLCAVYATNLLFGCIFSLLIVMIIWILWMQKKFDIPFVSKQIDLRQWLRTVAIVSFGWVVMGLGFFVVSSSIEIKTDVLVAISANSLATGFGILAVFAPGGIGIRELVFSFFAYASTTILIWRLTTFVVDIIAGAVSIWTIERSQK